MSDQEVTVVATAETQKLQADLKKAQKANLELLKKFAEEEKERQKYQKLMKEALLGAMKQALDIVATSADTTSADIPKEEIAATAYMKFSQKEFEAKVDAEVKKKTNKLKKELKNRIKHARDALTYGTNGTNKTKVAFVHTPLTNLFLPLRM